MDQVGGHLLVGELAWSRRRCCLGEMGCAWSDVGSNVAKSLRFGGKDYLFYDGYLWWGP